MEDLFITQILEGFKAFLMSIDWLFMVVFMLVTWLFNAGAKHPTKAKPLNFVQKIHPALFPLLLGVIIAIGYAYLRGFKTKDEIASLLYAIIFGMVIWKLGFNKFETWVENKLLKK